MTDDILSRAEALREDLKDGDDDYADEREIIAELIAEVKRLQSFADDLMDNCNSLRTRAQKAEAEVEHLRSERDDLKQKYQFMVDNAVAQKLDGYRELGLRAASAENQKDEQAAYLARLEAEYQKAYYAQIYNGSRLFGIIYTDEEIKDKARKSLERIKRGGQE